MGEHLELLIEAIADGSHQPDPAEAAHLSSCATCQAHLADARAIDGLLQMRDAGPPSGGFTAAVMMRVGQERWKTERVVDLGFNLAMLAGVLVILAGGAGLAWSLGFLSVTIDIDAVWQILNTGVTGRVLSQVQTVMLGAVLLTMALVLWWWAEAAAE